MSFYQTNDPDVLTSINKFMADRDILSNEGTSFAALFSAEKPIFYHSTPDCFFGGLIFKPSKDDRFWTKPDRKDQTQRPRNKVPGMTAEEKVSHDKLLEQWQSNFPKTHPSKNEIYKSIGTDWGNVMFGGGLGFFVHNESVYIDTNVTLGSNVTEILGSEYKAARADFETGAKS
jgi:hypothetical protein